jgi:hypothetical protein
MVTVCNSIGGNIYLNPVLVTIFADFIIYLRLKSTVLKI